MVKDLVQRSGRARISLSTTANFDLVRDAENQFKVKSGMQQRCLCPDCKASVPDIAGPVHAYLGANPGCWKLYGEVLVREYGNPVYIKTHRLTVDAYASQHPGKNQPRSAQSVNLHLMALYLTLEKQMPSDFVTRLLGTAVKTKKAQFVWLTPPISLGVLTVADVVSAQSPEEHAEKVRAWAKSVWQAWQPYRSDIERLAKEVL